MNHKYDKIITELKVARAQIDEVIAVLKSSDDYAILHSPYIFKAGLKNMLEADRLFDEIME